MSLSPPPANSNKPCPICGKPMHQTYRPFCSRRCADVDLNRWLGEVYTAPCAEEQGEVPENENF